MATAETIATALKDTFLDNLAQVDRASTDAYTPPIETQDTALIIPAFGQESEAGILNLSGDEYQTHRFRCEFWVKHTGDNGALTRRTRAVAGQAVKVLFNDPTLGDVIETVGYYDNGQFDYTIRTVIDDQLVTVGNANYLVATVIVPVTDFNPT